MNRKLVIPIVGFATALSLAAVARTALSNRTKAKATSDWRYYGGDSGGSKYSALDQINRRNVTQLKVAWAFHTGDLPDEKMAATFECTPLVVDGVMYITTAFSKVIALEAET